MKAVFDYLNAMHVVERRMDASNNHAYLASFVEEAAEDLKPELLLPKLDACGKSVMGTQCQCYEQAKLYGHLNDIYIILMHLCRARVEMRGNQEEKEWAQRAWMDWKKYKTYVLRVHMSGGGGANPLVHLWWIGELYPKHFWNIFWKRYVSTSDSEHPEAEIGALQIIASNLIRHMTIDMGVCSKYAEAWWKNRQRRVAFTQKHPQPSSVSEMMAAIGLKGPYTNMFLEQLHDANIDER